MGLVRRGDGRKGAALGCTLVAFVVAAAAAVRAPVAAGVPAPSTSGVESFPYYTGEEFTDLFDGLTLPDTAPLGDPPPISGDAEADERIRSIAVDRGYQLRPSSNGNRVWLGAEALQSDVAAAWGALLSAAGGAGIDLVLVSGYRSVADQRAIFLDELASEGVDRIGRPYTEAEVAGGAADAAIDAVLRLHSIPGYSKHHTAYAIDVTQQGFELADFSDTAAFRWLSADNYLNAKRHGFVPSYPPGAREQGPQPEPWEYVWVGARTIACRGVGGLQPTRVLDGPTAELPEASVARAPSRFVALAGERLIDTRTETSSTGYLCPGERLDVQVAGSGGVPADGVSAVVLNLTATQSAGPGFVTAWPTGGSMPPVSSLNTTYADQTVANLVTVPLGDGGRVSFFTLAGTHLVVDVFGYLEIAESATSGRFRSLTPQRVADTRTDDAPAGLVQPGETLEVDVRARAALGGDVGAVVLNVTATQPRRPGFVAVSPGDQEWRGTSNLNFDQPGHTIANVVVVPLGDDGTVDLLVAGGATHLVVDLFGVVTGGASDEGTSGLYVPVPPVRALDTRGGWAPESRVEDRGTVSAALAAAPGIADDASAVALNLTVTEPVGPGYLTVWPTGGEQPLVSNLNVSEPGETRANAAIVGLGESGRVSVFSHRSAHVVVDVYGYFTP